MITTDAPVCPGCGVPTERCSSALSRQPRPQRATFHSYHCWRLFYAKGDEARPPPREAA